MKIAVIGYSGSGKSTLAGTLGKYYACEVLHLDSVEFLPGWKKRPLDEKQRIVGEFLDSHDAWVIDGNYSKLFYDRRMEEADIIIELLFNRFSSLFRVWKRYRTYKNQTRPDMAEGCNEKLDGEFVRWVLWDGRKKAARKRYRMIKKQYGEKTVVIHTQKQMNKWLSENT